MFPWIVFLTHLLYLVSYVQAEFILVANPSTLELGITQDISLQCLFKGSLETTALRSLDRIRILKETSFEEFTIIAEVQQTDSNVHNFGVSYSANLTGYVGNVTSSFLKIFWKLGSSDILGIYRCDVIGFKADYNVQVESSDVVTINERSITLQDIRDLAVQQKLDIQQLIISQKAYCESQVAAVEAGSKTKFSLAEIMQYNLSKKLEGAILSKVGNLSSKVKRLKDTGVFKFWPEGTYGLLMPLSGCPETVGASWMEGSRKLHTESTDRNMDEISPNSHLQTPTMERNGTNNFLTQHFCVSLQRSSGPEWPRGAYCVNKVADDCPSGFSTGSITWQDEVTNSSSTYSGTLPNGVYAPNATKIDYCCRADGPADRPIYLPMDKPFYLYRYNGTCQAVVGMQGTAEKITFDTDNSNRDSYSNDYHPDGAINDVRIELCYYSVK